MIVNTLKKMLPAIALALTGTAVCAQDSSDDRWNWGAEIYFWGANLGGDTVTGGTLNLGIDDIIKDLKMGGMGALKAQKGNWSLFADLIYLDLGDSVGTVATIGGVPTPAVAKLEIKGAISTAGVGYRFYESAGTSIDALGGMRLLWLEADVGIASAGPPIALTDSGTNVDAIVGFRGQTDLSEKWYLDYYADIGAGESDLTWQAALGVNYRMKKADLAFGYRYMSWDLASNQLISDLNLSGVFAGVKFDF